MIIICQSTAVIPLINIKKTNIKTVIHCSRQLGKTLNTLVDWLDQENSSN